MNVAGARILLTGATGGIGHYLALELARRGASLALLARDENAVDELYSKVRALSPTAVGLPFDLASPWGHDDIVECAAVSLGGLDVIINNAGVQCFGELADENPSAISRLIAVNVTAPLLLTRAALRHFRTAGQGHVVNVGSTFGAIGYPHFAAYSASKFAVRGFSEALRREVSDAGVRVTYVSPRATDTAMNTPRVRELQARSGTRLDHPLRVADAVIQALENDSAERQLGSAERFFAKLNALLPRLFDKALVQQSRAAMTCVDRKTT
jgi:short-subunit dehydrogenase